MAERFEKVYSLPDNLYSEGSPVIISAGALLKDTETGKIIAQIKYQSISVTPIVALKVGISAYDVSGKEIDGVDEYQYLDLNIHNGQVFGSNKAILLPDGVTRSFSFNSIVVVLSNGMNYNVTLPMSTLPQATHLQSQLKNNELIKQYQLSVNKEAVYVPQENKELWSCSCGEWNSGGLCLKCGANKDVVFTAFDISTLTADMEQRLALEKAKKERQERAAEKARLDAIEREKIKKAQRDKRIKKFVKLLPIFAIVIVAIIILTIVLGVINKNSTYNNALELMNSENYEKALYEFATIPNYKDSSKNMEEIIDILMFTDDDISIRKAVRLLEAYPTGNEELLSLCQDIYCVEDNQYSLYISSYGTIHLSADYYLYNGKPYANVNYDNYLGEIQNDAIVDCASDAEYLISVSAVGKFKDQTNTLSFDFGTDKATAQIDDGKTYILAFDRKMNKEEYVTRAEQNADNEEIYQKANKLYDEKKYDEAIELYSQITPFKDSEDKIKQAENEISAYGYSEAEKLLNEGKNFDAAVAFYKLGNHSKRYNYST